MGSRRVAEEWPSLYYHVVLGTIKRKLDDLLCQNGKKVGELPRADQELEKPRFGRKGNQRRAKSTSTREIKVKIRTRQRAEGSGTRPAKACLGDQY
jgi:hypothetical protein